MDALTPVTAQLDAATLATVHELASARGITEEEFAADAIRRVAESEIEFRTFIQEGIDAADRGELVSQDEVERWFEERIAARHRA